MQFLLSPLLLLLLQPAASWTTSTRIHRNIKPLFSTTAAETEVQVNGDAQKSARIHGTVDLEKLQTLYDLIVVGGGPAGVAGAVKAAQMGRRAIVVDKPNTPEAVLENGLDLFFGAPTGLFSKALRDASKTMNVKAMRAQGLDDDVIWKQVENTIVKLAMRNSEGQMDLLKRLQVDYLQGEVMLLPEDDERAIEAKVHYQDELEDDEDSVARTVWVKNAPVSTKRGGVKEKEEVAISGANVLLCTGSRASQFGGIPFDGNRIFQSDSINNLSFLPHSVVISGAGIIAIEFANIFRNLGAEVTILIRGDLPTSAKKLGMDPDVTKELIDLLLESGVKIVEHATVDDFEHVPAPGQDGKVSLRLSNGDPMKSDIYLAALGRTPNGLEEDTGLTKAGVTTTEKGQILLDNKGKLQTASRNVLAAGDVIGWPSLASSSMVQAAAAVEQLFWADSKVTEESLFGEDMSIGIWTIPEIGYYGMTEEMAAEKGIKAVEGIARFDQCLRGRVFSPKGLLKLVVNAETGKVIGVHIIGSDAAEMIHYGMSLVKSNASINDLMATMFTAVTYHELFKEAALDADFKLDFGVEWQSIFRELSETCLIAEEDSSRPDQPEEGALREMFDLLDEDGSGGLDEEEMRALFQSLGRRVSKRTITNLMRLSDTDGNGIIDWDEFKAIWARVKC